MNNVPKASLRETMKNCAEYHDKNVYYPVKGNQCERS
jgi:hypothetical protein